MYTYLLKLLYSTELRDIAHTHHPPRHPQGAVSVDDKLIKRSATDVAEGLLEKATAKAQEVSE